VGVKDPAKDDLHFQGGCFCQEPQDGEHINTFDWVGRVWWLTEELQDKSEDPAAGL
jgi:hypothetical protein